MDRRRLHVERDNLVAALQKFAHDVGANVAVCTRHNYFHVSASFCLPLHVKVIDQSSNGIWKYIDKISIIIFIINHSFPAVNRKFFLSFCHLFSKNVYICDNFIDYLLTFFSEKVMMKSSKSQEVLAWNMYFW